MRSRYSAYALGLADYIMATTHKNHPHARMDPKVRVREILEFSKGTDFYGLSILKEELGDRVAFVTFVARLRSDGQDTTFTERSRFLKEHGKWLYESGVVQPGSHQSNN